MKKSLQCIFILVFSLSVGWTQSAMSQTVSLSGSTGGTCVSQNTAVLVASGASISGLGNIDGATVSINNFVSGQDVLEVTGQTSPFNGITFSVDNNKGIIKFSGNAAISYYETLLRAVTYKNTSATPNTTTRSITINLGTGLKLEGTGHYYDYITKENVTWSGAKADAATKKYMGLQGYLVTIMSQEEQDFCSSKISVDTWIGGSDDDVEGEWAWVSGPEDGQYFWSGGAPVVGMYSNWNDKEPNNSNGNESCAEMLSTGKWNDLSSSSTLSGYLIEYGDMAGDEKWDISDNVTIPIIYTPTATAATNITSTSFSANWNAAAGASNYFLDVATDNLFISFVTGYKGKSVGNVTTSSISGLEAGTTYYYRVRSVSTGQSSNIITVSTPISLNGSNGGTCVAQGTAVSIASGATISGSGNIDGAKVFIENFVSGQDILEVTGYTSPNNGISFSFDNVKGILLVKGNASVASYQTLLKAVSYKNSLANPATATRNITI
ncbi:MAG TPA: lectin-like protein, partial [Prolixibacteraceae bacterium]|nr:lectin-like protein [Prolixibacteraceae bacterium]